MKSYLKYFLALNIKNEKYNKIDCLMETDNCFLKADKNFFSYATFENALVESFIKDGVL